MKDKPLETCVGALYDKTPVDHSRRRFVSQAASVAVGGAAVAAVVGIPTSKAAALPLDDSALVKLEEQIFEEYEAAHAYDDEIIRLGDIWRGELYRLYEEANDGRSILTVKERWELVCAMPESKEHNRLVRLQDLPFGRMNDLIGQMFAIPAHTAEGRRAKVAVLLTCIMGSEWTGVDAETDYAELEARNLLIEFVGGEPGQMLRGQFA
jgi:hypothetical protein